MPAQYHIGGSTASAIAESLERAIDAGRFAEGEALPTIRELANRLGVSPTTVSAAFGHLRRRGRIVGRRRGGSVVVPRVALQSGDPHPIASVARNLAVANPDAAFLPSLREALARSSADKRLYTDIRDSGPLLATMRARFESDGVAAEHLGVASGAMDAIERALVATLAPGDLLALEDPTYPPYAALARALELQVVRVAIDGRGLVPASLASAVRSGAKALVTIPRAQNPTGAAFDAERVRALHRALAAAPDLLVIEDDYVAAVSDVDLATLTGGRRRFLHVRSLAKIFGPDLRIAPYAGDELTVSRMLARQRLGAGWVSVALQEAASFLLRDAATKRRVRAATLAYRHRRQAFVAACREAGVALAPGGSGFTVWIPVRDEVAAVEAARRAGFAIDGGARYRGISPPGVRVTTTSLDGGEIARLVAALTPRARAERGATSVARP